MWYLGVFLVALGVDLIPVFAPPAWTLMVLLMVKFDLNPWVTVLVGVTGSTLGRYLFGLYVPKFSRRILKQCKNDELEFLGQKLSESLWKAWAFVFIYSLTPLSTTALFTTAALGKVKPKQILPPFFLGKLISNGIMIATGNYMVSQGLRESLLTPKSIFAAAFGFILLFAILFVDWRGLLEKHTLKFKFKIWK